MTQPFFSLITPVYNIEKLISATIESALSQTFSDWEMILVDDGSPDNAGKICDEYAAKYKKIKVIHKKNEGLAAARNDGIKACSGKYFLIYEGSDLFPEDTTLEKIHSVLKDVDVEIFFGKLQDVLENTGEIIGQQKDYCINGLFTEGGKKLFETLFDNDDVLALSSPVNKLFRTDFIKQNELWFCKGIYHDDDEWLPRTISLSEKTYFTNDIIYSALTWDGCFGQSASDKSLTKKACDKMFLALRCMEDLDNRFHYKDDSFKQKYFEYFFRIYMSGITSINEIKDDVYKAQVKESIKKYEKAFIYARRSNSRNIRLLGLIKSVFGLKLATKLVLKRYG